jgi:hypothetical protein
MYLSHDKNQNIKMLNSEVTTESYRRQQRIWSMERPVGLMVY